MTASTNAERAITHRLAKTTLAADQYAMFCNHRWTQRFHITDDDTLHVMRYSQGKVEALQLLTPTAIRGDLMSGVILDFAEGRFSIGHAPKLLPGTDLFLWLPADADLRYRPDTGLSINLVFRSARAPGVGHDGNTYIIKS